MKKTLLAGSLISLFLATFAYADNQRPSFNGFYAGLGAGYLRSDANISENFTVNQELEIIVLTNNFLPPIPITFPVSMQSNQSYHQSLNTAMGDIVLGYGHQIAHHFYAGIEGFANWSPRQFEAVTHDAARNENNIIFGVANFATTSHSSTEVSLNSGEYGGDLRLGVLTNSLTTLIYGTVGAAYNKLQLLTSNDATATFSIPLTTLFSIGTHSTITGNDTKSVIGWRLGFGIEQLINCHWSVRADYAYTDYGNVATQAAGNASSTSVNFTIPNINDGVIININPNRDTLSQTASAHIRSNAVTLGLSYYF